jgi:DNA-binding NtrC family response regulator
MLTDIVLLGNAQAGLDLAKEAVKRQPDLKVLYTTGQAITDGIKAMMVKGSAVLEKPYTVDQLQTALLWHLGIRPNSPNRT